jgi:capsular exopolysaccharide synthesis family protein
LASLRDYVSVVRRRKWVVILAVVVVPLLATVLSARKPPLYSADAEVYLNRQNLSLMLTGTADLAASQPERTAETQAQLARVPAVAERVLKQTRITDLDVGYLLGHVAVTPKANADFLEFSFYDRLPARAVLLANGFAAQYVAYKRDLDTSSLSRARREVEAEIERLRREGGRGSDLYTTLVAKQQQLGTIEALQTSNASVVRKATGAYKISPQPKRSAMLGLGLGVILGIGLAFLLEALDMRARSTQEIENILELPLLGRLTAPPRDLADGGGLVMIDKPRSTHAEAFRILRSNLEFHNLEHHARTIMVTSCLGAEGKSTTIANLGAALAAAGHRVTLIDLDLRRPSLDKYLGLHGQLGVTDMADGRAKLEEAPLETFEETSRTGTLEVLTTRPMLKDSDGFIASKELDDILSALRARSDYVLIDAPPLLLVGDAMQLTGKVDAILVVARLNVVRRQMLRELKRVLDTVPAAKLGFAVTGAQLEHDYQYVYSYDYYRQPTRGRRT